MCTGKPVSLENLLSIFFNKAPPPVRVKPISTKSADSSGGVFSKASFIPFTISFKIINTQNKKLTENKWIH